MPYKVNKLEITGVINALEYSRLKSLRIAKMKVYIFLAPRPN